MTIFIRRTEGTVAVSSRWTVRVRRLSHRASQRLPTTMPGLVIVFICSGIFTVPSQQKAIILRFGKPVGTGEKMLLEPGLHWSFPYPIDQKIFIPLGQQNVQSTVGWYAVTSAGEPINPGAPSLNPAAEGYTITADANIIHVRATFNYRITDPLKYELNFVSASN